MDYQLDEIEQAVTEICEDNKPEVTEFTGGQIANYRGAWSQISSDPWLLNSIQGVEIPFFQIPVQLKEPRPYNLSEEEKLAVDQEIDKFLQKEIIERVEPEWGQVISNVFLRPKKDGGHRMILDLTWVNLHVKYEHFKMHSIQTALEMMRMDCWMASIDLKDAYYSVPVKAEQRKFLRFRWKGELFQFKVLPNGLACAPRCFTKILNPVFASLRELGVEAFPYIDDSFIVADSSEVCKESVDRLADMLGSLGFVLHQQKSVMEPTKELTFLGFNLNSEELKVFLTEDKEEKLIRAAESALENRTHSIREIAGLIGLMIAFAQAFRYAEAYIKHLEMDKVQALRRARGNFDDKMLLSDDSIREIHWWLSNVRQSGRPIRMGPPQLMLFTDASNEGWGAHLGETAIGGRWSEKEKEEHINALELKAIQLGLEALCEGEGVHIRIMTDSTTAMAYIKHHGGVRSEPCNEIAQQIWQWAERRDMWLSAAHIPGVENTLADYKSRHFADNLEWSLNDKLYEKVVDAFGEPEIDLFATRLNCKVPKFVAWLPEPLAVAIDAFSMSWTDLRFYAFPPFSCVGKAVEKALEERATGVLIVPWWPSQPWWGRLVSLGLRHLRFRPKKNNLIKSGKPDNEQLLSKCPLGAFRFWGKRY